MHSKRNNHPGCGHSLGAGRVLAPRSLEAQFGGNALAGYGSWNFKLEIPKWIVEIKLTIRYAYFLSGEVQRFGQVNRSGIPDRYDLRSGSHGYQPELVRPLRVLLLLALLINAQMTQWERNRQEFD